MSAHKRDQTVAGPAIHKRDQTVAGPPQSPTRSFEGSRENVYKTHLTLLSSSPGEKMMVVLTDLQSLL
jgi:hypothetical protein